MSFFPFISILGFIAFCVIHSTFAHPFTKTWIISHFPQIQRHYRWMFNALSLLLFGIWWTLASKDSVLLYQFSVFGTVLGRVVQVLALIGLWWVVRKTQTGVFLGTAQLTINKLELDEPQQSSFTTSGWYHFIRHPLYSLNTLFLIAQPTWDTRWLILTIGSILYFWLGSMIEERKLRDRFGAAYAEYQAKTGRFIPKWSRLRRKV